MPAKINVLYSKKFYWLSILVILIVKYGYYGFKYFPVLDDNNIYGVFSKIPVGNVFFAIAHDSFFKIRPFAAILDFTLWSRFWGNLWIPLLFITLMHFFSCYFISEVFDKNNSKIGNIPVIFYMIMPLQFQATYWISASARVVQGIFFASLSFYLLMLYIESLRDGKPGRLMYLLGFFISNLLSMGFYEQITAVSLVITLYIIFLNRKIIADCLRKLKLLLYSLPVINFLLIAMFYAINSKQSAVASRGTIFVGDYIQHAYHIFDNLYLLIRNDLILFMKYQIMDGLSHIVSDRAYLYLLIIIMFASLFAFWTGKEQRIQGKNKLSRIKLGLFLIIISLIPFYVINDTNIFDRNILIAIISLGILVDALINYITGETAYKVVKASASFIFCITFLLGSVSALYNYKSASQTDESIVKNYIEASRSIKPADEKKGAIVFNTQKKYYGSATMTILNCTSSDWALLGAVQAASLKLNIYPGFPVNNNSQFRIKKTDLQKRYYIGMDNNLKFYELNGVWINENTMRLYTTGNLLFGEIKSIADDSFEFKLSNAALKD